MTPTAAAREVMDAGALREALERIRDAILTEFPEPAEVALLGVRTRGVVLAERLNAMLAEAYGAPLDIGILDITLYRDDLSTLGPQPMVHGSEIDFDVTDRHLVLVDDVLYTGRTVRAAMEEIIDFGRPACIRLAVLVDRGWREYPVQADYVGLKLPTKVGETVSVRLRETDGQDGVVVSLRG